MTRLAFMLVIGGILCGLPLLVDDSISASQGRNSPAYRFEELADGVHFAIGTGAMTVMSMRWSLLTMTMSCWLIRV